MVRLRSLIILCFLSHSLFGHEAELVKSMNTTGIFVYYILDKNQNTVISPLSLTSSLLLAYMGARGETAKEMASALSLTLPQDEVGKAYAAIHKYLTGGMETILMGNSIWVDDQVQVFPSYIEMAKEDFFAKVKMVDFQNPLKAIHDINTWVANHTKNKITEFLQPSEISPSDKLILLNGLYVTGSWRYPFPTERSGVEPFLTQSGQSINAQMMNQKNVFPYFENEETQVLILPLENLNASLGLALFLPKKRQSELFNFYYTKDESKPDGFLSYLEQTKPTYMDVTIPKFLIAQKLKVTGLLGSIGIKLATSTNADFSGIDGKKDLMISKAAQQCVISINEGGLFASAASGTTFSLKSTPPGEPTARFKANRPFLYALVDFKTQLLLFIGECLDPTQTEIKVTESKNR